MHIILPLGYLSFNHNYYNGLRLQGAGVMSSQRVYKIADTQPEDT
jgi:hypothetical protein